MQAGEATKRLDLESGVVAQGPELRRCAGRLGLRACVLLVRRTRLVDFGRARLELQRDLREQLAVLAKLARVPRGDRELRQGARRQLPVSAFFCASISWRMPLFASSSIASSSSRL